MPSKSVSQATFSLKGLLLTWDQTHPLSGTFTMVTPTCGLALEAATTSPNSFGKSENSSLLGQNVVMFVHVSRVQATVVAPAPGRGFSTLSAVRPLSWSTPSGVASLNLFCLHISTNLYVSRSVMP